MFDFTLDLESKAYVAGIVLMLAYGLWLVPIVHAVFMFMAWEWEISKGYIRLMGLLIIFTLIAAYGNQVALKG